METFQNKVLGNPLPFLGGGLVGYLISKELKTPSFEKSIMFIVGFGFIGALCYLGAMDKGKGGNSIEVTDDAPVIGHKETGN